MNLTCPVCATSLTLSALLPTIQCPVCRSVLHRVQSPPPRPAAQAPAPSPASEFWPKVWTGTKIALAAYATFKLGQRVFGQDFGDRRFFPQEYRDQLREDHIEEHGLTCPDCDADVEWGDLVVDHKLAHVNGGRTASWNARLTGRRCNSSKGAKNSIFDRLFFS